MKIFRKINEFWNKISTAKSKQSAGVHTLDLEDRMARLERHYLVLLKQILKMDGVELHTNKAANLTSKVLKTPRDATNKSLHATKPTIH